MKLVIVAVGHRMPAWVSTGFEEYARRMPREARVSLIEVKPDPRRAAAGNGVAQRALEAEHKRIVAAMPKDCFRVVLDERGRSVTTRSLAAELARWRQAGRDVAFVIGGADGTATALKEECDLLWALSSLTLPHQLVRILLAEQLYRAASMLAGHPYHRE